MGLNGATDANAYASQPTAVVYQPKDQYDSVRGARVVVIRQGRGKYLVIPAGSHGKLANGGNVAVSAVGTSDDHCYVDHWIQGVTPDIYVDCVNSHGAAADSAFTIQWVVA